MNAAHSTLCKIGLRVRCLYAASESCAQISLYVVGSRRSRAVPPRRPLTGADHRTGQSGLSHVAESTAVCHDAHVAGGSAADTSGHAPNVVGGTTTPTIIGGQNSRQ